MREQPLFDIGLADILTSNASLAVRLTGKRFTIRVLSNVTVAPLKDILEFELRRNGINAVVEFGDYDNIAQNSLEAGLASAVAILWDLANLVESFHSRALTMDSSALEELENKTRSEIDFVLENLREAPLVLFNTYSTLVFNSAAVNSNPLDRVAASLNSHLWNARYQNLTVIDIDRCIARISTGKAVDWRTWHSSRLLYSVDFFKSYASLTAPVYLALNGKAKKALIFDCDNTLWGGIVGEDGIEGIHVSPSIKAGQPFHEVQTLALALHRQGVILGLCSKNNPADVDEVLQKHPGMVLRDEHFVIKRVNWHDKAKNLQEIAEALNIGLDSLVFVDDSEFEASLVERYLPQVCVLRVPKSPSAYPQFFRDHMQLFWVGRRTAEDEKRSSMYKQQDEREETRTKFSSLDDYLRSLDLALTVYCNPERHASRVAQLTQKTNQFNLTTKRYSEADIAFFVASPDWLLYCFSLADRFGDFGLTGVALVRVDCEGSSAEFDTLLLSCRVLGRNAELKFFDYIVDQLRARGVHTIIGRFLRSAKNAQVESFFDARGFALVSGNEDEKIYRIGIADYRPAAADYVQLHESE